jgi:hypothetical protein
VEKGRGEREMDQEAGVIKIRSDKMKVIPILPKIGKIFMIEGQEYVVTYVNEGKIRFSAEVTRIEESN